MEDFMRKGFFKTTLLLIALPLIGATSFAKEKNDYTDAMRKYLEVSGTTDQMSNMMTGMLEDYLDLDNESRVAFEDSLKETVLDILVEFYEPIYKKHFTIDEINEILKFYDSPIGKKLVAENSAMVNEVMETSYEMYNRLALKIAIALSELGIDAFEEVDISDYIYE